MRSVLHIGMPKCGSTSLQAFLCLNSERLLRDGIIYPHGPQYPRPDQHSWIFEQIDKANNCLGELFLSMRGHDVSIVSAESLVFLTTAQLRQLRTRMLGEAGTTSFQIIFYVRNLADTFLSGAAEIASSFGQPYLDVLSWQPSLTGIIERSENVFGRDAVNVRLLDGALDLEHDFFDAALLPWRDDYERAGKQNVSADPISVQLLQLLQFEFGRAPADRGLLPIRCRLPRLENFYLAVIAERLPYIDISHTKLTGFTDQLRAINWRNEKAGPDFKDYAQNLIVWLEGMCRERVEGASPPVYDHDALRARLTTLIGPELPSRRGTAHQPSSPISRARKILTEIPKLAKNLLSSR
jgi:hypothetical protein